MDKTKCWNGFYIQFRQTFAKETLSYDEHLCYSAEDQYQKQGPGGGDGDPEVCQQDGPTRGSYCWMI